MLLDAAAVRVMLHPVRAYRELAVEAKVPSRLAMLGRPAFFALLLGSSIALSTIGRFSLRLILSSALLWSFAPALQLLAVSVVIMLLGERRMPLRAGIDLFFLGIGPWSLWLLAIGAVFSLVPPRVAAALVANHGQGLRTSAVPFLWSALVTYGFLRGALAMSRARATAALLLHHVLVWGPAVLFFLLSDQLVPRLAGFVP